MLAWQCARLDHRHVTHITVSIYLLGCFSYSYFSLLLDFDWLDVLGIFSCLTLDGNLGINCCLIQRRLFLAFIIVDVSVVCLLWYTCFNHLYVSYRSKFN